MITIENASSNDKTKQKMLLSLLVYNNNNKHDMRDI